MKPEKTIEDAERDAEAARLRSRGATYPEIARTQGCALSTAYERVKRAIAAVPFEAVAELRALENERLDDLWKIAWREATRDHVLVSDGKIVKDENGDRLVNHAVKLQAVTTLVRIAARRARLHGLDAPMQFTGALAITTETVLDHDIRVLIEQMTAGTSTPVDVDSG